LIVLAVALASLSGLVCMVWLSRHVLLSREQRAGLVLTPRSPGAPTRRPRLSVVVAAKDEEANLETCLRTLLDQDYGDFEVVVCNDRSTDRTGEIAERLAAKDQRLRVVHVKELPAGWCGKNNAMRLGIAQAGGEWLCMTDADCRFLSPRTLSVAVRHALDSAADLLSVLPTLEMRGFWENVVQPVCGGLMMIWFRPDKVNDPERPNAYANGAFILMKRTAYDALGGHEAVKDQVNEDMHLAALCKEKGLRLRVIRNDGLYLVRMYTSLRGIVRGWGRIFFGTFGTRKRLSISLAVLLVMGVLPYLAAGLGLGLAAAGAAPVGAWWACGALGSAAAIVQLSVVARFYRFTGAGAGLAWAYLLGCAVTMAALVGALRKLRPGAQVVWRDTRYSRGKGVGSRE
jgi:glycosyltransferase involved in cell wall biosynthesis